MMNPINRRRFLKNSFLSAAAASLPVRSWSQVPGANTDIRVAVVGFNGQGRVHIEGFRKMPGVRVVALCDADRNVLDREAIKFYQRGEKVAKYTDVRRLLENADIDVVTTATPNHWHALVSIWAIQAGKDVYVEKPVSHNVWEGRQIVRAARKHGKIVQTGTQSRSSSGVREGIEYLRSGELGPIKLARGLCYKRRQTLGLVNGAQPVPGTVDYDLWTGPAALEPLNRYRLLYDWHWVWNTGNGDIGNQGIHEMDMARWALGQPRLSPAVVGVGGRFGYQDDGETANTQIVAHQYPEAPLIFEVRGLPERSGSEAMSTLRGARVGVIIECENGSLVIQANQAIAYDATGVAVKTFGDKREDHRLKHRVNFIEAVRSRDHTHLNADIEEGHISSALCHTANISHRLGQAAGPHEIREELTGDAAASEAFGRLTEHLQANQIDLNLNLATLGAPLVMNPEKETFYANSRANALLTREYRKGFAVPRRV
jgi:predicted dehydrogenase